ncbi:calcium/proton exchanger [Roseisolibacter agri]|uniref:Ca(2+)/H(+) antiporter n=1 Tax=Roseisolibacter agri TaxID=2014610 RepID=A0AA37QJD3_9BACT|nr:calcium/proton exchanger [Roseisolibacter agri]GLC26888.1 Ca(2+)/H(+) antiporter ChaA [Roseisolibacter agri]
MPVWLKDNWLLLLLVFVPVALVLEHVVHAAPLAVFLASSAAIIPLAALMGRATERLAEQLGEGIGGLLNATFGNAAELIIAIVALRAGYFDLVKASITGSIIGNVLLVFGASALWGGIKYERQHFNQTAAGLSSTLLVLSAISLFIPAIFHLIVGNTAAVSERTLSVEISVVLILTYVASLFFSLRTHKHLYVGEAGDHSAELTHGGGSGRAVALLLAATAGVALMSELLVGAVEATAESFGMNQVFVGVILVALIGNAAEHSSAILMASRNKMDAAITIAVGSSIQVALFVAPVLVFLSYVVAPQPMDLRFTTLEVVAVGISVWIMTLVAQDGESHWMEGVQLLAVYTILAFAFFWLPGGAH